MSQPANDEFSQHLSDDEASNHEDASDTGALPLSTLIMCLKKFLLLKNERKQEPSYSRLFPRTSEKIFTEWMMQKNLEAIRTKIVFENAKFKRR
ncbi:hypothetical protein Tco_0149326 [Tanacetum coccineum]